MSGCRNPALGAHVDGYVEGSLPDPTREAFEMHLFECPTCLEEVETRQSLAEALRTARELPRPRMRRSALIGALAIAAVVVGAIILVPVLRNGPSPSQTSFVLTLEGTVRATAEAPEAPPDTPLTLVFRVPVPTERRVSYELRIVDAGGEPVRELTGLQPTDRTQVRAEIGILPTGTFEATLREVSAGSETPLTLRYQFTVSGRSPR